MKAAYLRLTLLCALLVVAVALPCSARGSADEIIPPTGPITAVSVSTAISPSQVNTLWSSKKVTFTETIGVTGGPGEIDLKVDLTYTLKIWKWTRTWVLYTESKRVPIPIPDATVTQKQTPTLPRFTPFGSYKVKVKATAVETGASASSTGTLKVVWQY